MTMTTTSVTAATNTPAARRIPGVCWALPIRYTHDTDWKHFPTQHDALEAVRADDLDRWQPDTTPDPVNCKREKCVIDRKLADDARLVLQEQLAAEQVLLEQARYDEQAAYQADSLRAATIAARQDQEYYQRRIELKEEAAARHERELELLADESNQREAALQLARDQRDAQETAQQEQAAIERARRLVDRSGGEISKADQKAGGVVAIAALIGTVGAGMLDGGGVLRWVALGSLLAGVLTAAWAMLPRMPRRTGTTGQGLALNFGAVRQLTADELADELRDVDELHATSQEAVVLARISHRKYTAIRWSMLISAAGLLAGVASVVVGSW